jgi:hypothetical protein
MGDVDTVMKKLKILVGTIVSVLLIFSASLPCLKVMADPQSFKMATLETNYYRAVTNTDGSLTFLSIHDGAKILDRSPQYVLAYGTTRASINPLNNSFEIASSDENAPKNWTVDNNCVRLSTERASGGNKALKFAMAAPDVDHRRVYSSILPVAPESYYTIAIDSYGENGNRGNFRVYSNYFETTDGTGVSHLSPDFLNVPLTTNTWKTSSLEWNPPPAARSFQILIYADKQTTGTVYLDNVTVVQDTYSYIQSAGGVDSKVISRGNSSVVTSIDDTNPFTTVTHSYELAANSPVIKYTATLRYKQNVSVIEEKFNFRVPLQSAKVMTRDLRLTDFDPSKIYSSDLFTPKVVKFANGLSFLGEDTMNSMELSASGTDCLVSFYSDSTFSHPHSYWVKNGEGQTVDVGRTRRSAGDIYAISVAFVITSGAAPKTLVKTRQPYAYDATLIFTNHPDTENLKTVKAVAYGTEDETDPDFGGRGIVGKGIGWTKGCFVSGYKGADLQDDDYRALTDQMYRDGVEIVGHSITPVTDSRDKVLQGLNVLSRYNASNWIDHSADGGKDNWEALASQGALQGDDNYILDLLAQHNYRYAWSYIDLPTANYGLNLLEPAATSDVRPFLFYNNQVDDNSHSSQKLYLWSTMNTNKAPDLFYTRTNVDDLIAQRGIHIGHEYLGYPDCNNHAWYANPVNGKIEIYPVFDDELVYIAEKCADGVIWSPTVSEMGDYLIPLENVSITYDMDGSFTVTNYNSSLITGVTLLAEENLRSVSIDNQKLVSFGGSFGEKQIVLPTLRGGQSISLRPVYGAKDNSIPTITSNDTGKWEVTEITGTWSNSDRVLTMTAEGDHELHSFAVRIPELSDTTLVVKDAGLGTTIGSYKASSKGEITFLARLGSLHTFTIGDK